MQITIKALFAGLILAVCSTLATADDIDGKIESINQDDKSFVVKGIRFFATETTDYDKRLKGFADLKVGQRVEVDFDYRDNKHFATEIELD